ncbi:MAG: Rieske 2Fe-2S domain-containing protein [Actinobacteria bacterium]|nr:Rieske 2Fe-2S domain-containing protein [Actinomycetota bacterium]
MSSTTIIVLALVALAVLAILFFATAGAGRDRAAAINLRREARKKDKANPALTGEGGAVTGREVERNAKLERRGSGELVSVSAEAAPPAPFIPPDPDVIAVTRRQFLNRGSATLMGISLATFGAAVLAFLWPQLGTGFGAKINAGKLSEIQGTIRDTKAPFYVAEARTWLSAYPDTALSKAKAVYSGGVLDGMEQGVVALYQKCVHLGCRVPWCGSAQWFECPCHGSKYNRVGEKKGGPAPRGLDRFAVSIANGNVMIDTGKVIQGPPIGTNTTGQEQEGPHCA